MANADYAYTLELAKEICLEVSSTHFSLDWLCKSKRAAGENWPSTRTIFNWLAREPEFCAMYDAAIRAKIRAHENAIVDAVYDSSQDIEERKLQLKMLDMLLRRAMERDFRQQALSLGVDHLQRAASEVISTMASNKES